MFAKLCATSNFLYITSSLFSWRKFALRYRRFYWFYRVYYNAEEREERERGKKREEYKTSAISLIHLAPVDLNHTALPHIYSHFRYLQIYRYIYVHILWNRTAVLSCYCKIIVAYQRSNFHRIIIYDRFAFAFAMVQLLQKLIINFFIV